MKIITILLFSTLIASQTQAEYIIKIPLEENGGHLPKNSIVIHTKPNDTPEEKYTCNYSIGGGTPTHWRHRPFDENGAGIYWNGVAINSNNQLTDPTTYVASDGVKYKRGEHQLTLGPFLFYEICRIIH